MVTEQVYVHTKLMIVDDLYALLGSANVNDRSLLGMRDSEIAVLVEDGKTARADINGTGSQRPIRHFAHDLRKQIWSKLFGITGNVRPATELQQAINQPGSPDSWKLIQRRAATNAELYEAAFLFVPRSRVMGSDNKSEPVQDVVSVGHEPAFKHSDGADNLRACRFTLRAITRIAQEVSKTDLKYD